MRSVVTIRVPASNGAAARQLDLGEGDRARFAPCRCGTCDLDIRFAQGTPWFAGEILARSDHWLVSNLGSGQALLVENLENSYEYLTVEAGRSLVPVPFELSRVGLAGRPRGPKLTVFGPEPRQADLPLTPCAQVSEPRPALNPRAAYFAVLRTLCEPRLRGAPSTPLPTSEEIARRLGSSMTVRAVDAHIEYLTGKLGLTRGCGRDVLVATAIRHRLVPM
ncbi:MAG TPA: hypothetical protein VF054_04135 [Micromonosporaceae bacterium]